jgi:hypothetical protein
MVLLLSSLDNQNVLYKMWYVPIVELFDLGKDNYMLCSHVNYFTIWLSLPPYHHLSFILNFCNIVK